MSQQIELSRVIVFDRHFLLLLLSFGLVEGTVYSIHTLLNQMINRTPLNANSGPAATLDLGSTNGTTASGQRYWPDILDDPNIVVGNTGLISILAGLLGSALCGYLLDKYHRYKLTALSVYLLILAAMLAFTACLRLNNTLGLYLVAIPLGLAFTGYASCGFDYGVEITYPAPELLSSTMLNMSAQICGIPISLIGSLIVDAHGGETLGLFFSAIILAGLLVACLQGGQLKRQQAVREGHQDTTVSMPAVAFG